MQMPEFSFNHTFPDTIKGWEAWRENRTAWYEYWAWNAKRRFHARPEDKGIPVPGTGRWRWHSSKNSGKTGVIGSSRMLPHRYMDEGDKGKGHNRHIKRLERALWQREWLDEGYDVEDAVTVAQWFYDMSDDTDSDLIPSVYTVGETVVEWPNDYYDEYGYAYDSYAYYDDYDSSMYYPNTYDREMMGDDPNEDYEGYCFMCGGPCEF